MRQNSQLKYLIEYIFIDHANIEHNKRASLMDTGIPHQRRQIQCKTTS